MKGFAHQTIVGTLVSERDGEQLEGFERRNDRGLTYRKGIAVLSVFCRRVRMDTGSPVKRLWQAVTFWRCDGGLEQGSQWR